MVRIKLGVIGIGMAWERLHYPAIKQLGDRYEIVALCNRTKEDALQFARRINLDPQNVYDDYQEMLSRDDIDAVDVLVPISENFEVAAAVIRAGKHLIAEKPLAATMEGAHQLISLQKKHQVMVLVAENYRYSEEYNKIRDIMVSGKIGEVVYFTQNNVFDFKQEMTKDTFAGKEWRQHPNYYGGAFLDAAIHDIAGLRHLFGAVDTVYSNGLPQQEDFCPYVSIHTQMQFQNGVIGQYTYFPNGKETQAPLSGLRIYGTQGEIYLEDKSCGFINLSYRNGNRDLILYTPDQGYYNELLNFYNGCIGSEAVAVTPEIEIGDMKMVFDILTSLETRSPVEVDAFDSKSLDIPHEGAYDFEVYGNRHYLQ